MQAIPITEPHARKQGSFAELLKNPNLFLLSGSQEDINKIAANPALVDEWVSAKAYVLSTDVETAWDVLRSILSGVGIAVLRRHC